MVQLTYHRTATAIAISYGGSLFIGVSDVSYYSLAVLFIGVKDAMQFWDVLLPIMPGSFVHWQFLSIVRRLDAFDTSGGRVESFYVNVWKVIGHDVIQNLKIRKSL